MKLTKSKLTQLVKEELKNFLNENIEPAQNTREPKAAESSDSHAKPTKLRKLGKPSFRLSLTINSHPDIPCLPTHFNGKLMNRYGLLCFKEIIPIDGKECNERWLALAMKKRIDKTLKALGDNPEAIARWTKNSFPKVWDVIEDNARRKLRRDGRDAEGKIPDRIRFGDKWDKYTPEWQQIHHIMVYMIKNASFETRIKSCTQSKKKGGLEYDLWSDHRKASGHNW